MLGLRFCARAFSSCGERATLHRGVRASHCRGLSCCGAQAPRRAGSVVVAHGPSCSAECGIFPDQGSNPCPLHWQADSQPLRHQGSPILIFLYTKCSILDILFITNNHSGKSLHISINGSSTFILWLYSILVIKSVP